MQQLEQGSPIFEFSMNIYPNNFVQNSVKILEFKRKNLDYSKVLVGTEGFGMS
jgi:hypothetical protein